MPEENYVPVTVWGVPLKFNFPNAGMAESADVADLKSVAQERESSSLSSRTIEAEQMQMADDGCPHAD